MTQTKLHKLIRFSLFCISIYTGITLSLDGYWWLAILQFGIVSIINLLIYFTHPFYSVFSLVDKFVNKYENIYFITFCLLYLGTFFYIYRSIDTISIGEIITITIIGIGHFKIFFDAPIHKQSKSV